MHDFMKTIISAIKNWTNDKIEESQSCIENEIKDMTDAIEIAQAAATTQVNWNQTDETAIDYIKNRTHYANGLYNYICFEDYLDLGSSKTVTIDFSISAGALVHQYFDGVLLCTVTAYVSGDKVYASDGRIAVSFFEDNTMQIGNYYGSGTIKIVVDNIIELKTLDDIFIPDTVTRNDELVAIRSTGLGSVILNDLSSNVASSVFSYAEGIGTTASGYNSHAEGYVTNASGYVSHAEGACTIAASNYQHAQGKFNIEDKNHVYAHIVGNGTSVTSRSNAHTLDWEGNAWYQGEVYVGGTGQDNATARLLKTSETATEDDILDTLSEMSYIDPIAASDGSIYTNNNGEIYIL